MANSKDLLVSEFTESADLKPPVCHMAAANLGGWPSRTLCAAISDMRDQLKAYNNLVEAIIEHPVDRKNLKTPLAVLASLVEEFQVYGNRMEAALEDRKEYEELKASYKDLEVEKKKLKEDIVALKKERSELEMNKYTQKDSIRFDPEGPIDRNKILYTAKDDEQL